MAKRTVRRPTEDQALGNVMRDQRRLAKQAVQQVLRSRRNGEWVDPEILKLAQKVFLGA